ncbi:hypothetical protein ACZ11_24575 [Lysinibacillus xylanilyticus]|uniref:Uncharacterized protein n=1 Tax=Lysinibacillus xylanilyticus TaxID=582475 RepID=A0A0K9F1C6_9BACI|nr:hypothetical protein [Lysinibacillus xylanilyticus]KMY28399.1 hypothetical protein ACZ11_24575 [Lysinibacillus xylanilyticus]
MKEYFLTEEQYCDNAFVTNIVPLPLRFRAKDIVPLPLRLALRFQNIFNCRFALAQKTLIGLSGSSEAHRKSTTHYGDKLKN